MHQVHLFISPGEEADVVLVTAREVWPLGRQRSQSTECSSSVTQTSNCSLLRLSLYTWITLYYIIFQLSATADHHSSAPALQKAEDYKGFCVLWNPTRAVTQPVQPQPVLFISSGAGVWLWRRGHQIHSQRTHTSSRAAATCCPQRMGGSRGEKKWNFAFEINELIPF